MTVEHAFFDPLSQRPVTLVLGGGPDNTGVRHDECEALAYVSPEFDTAYCMKCRWQCRISGAWFIDVLRAHPESGDSEPPFRST